MVDPPTADLGGWARRVMEEHWVEADGFTVPHRATYPWMWLWDSCFHSIVWAALGRGDRARRELAAVFAAATPSGFVPHMNYGSDGAGHPGFWGVAGCSTITQPPMYGHALAVLAGAGVDIGGLAGAVTTALHHLLDVRATPCGLLRVVHPWENGTDDSPRWERWQGARFDRAAWAATKAALVGQLVLDGREAVGNRAFEVCPAGWNALVAFNAAEAAAVTGDRALADRAAALARGLDDRCFDDALGTWVDVDGQGAPTSRVRTLDGLLGVLVTDDPSRVARVLAEVADPGQYGTPFGPSGVHVGEAAYDPGGYWRGSSWPPLDYLLRTAADRSGQSTVAAALGRALVDGGRRSGMSEYRHPETGRGLGATPQGWACLAAVPRAVSSPGIGAGLLPELDEVVPNQ
jgi:hypothetical protein